MIPAYTTPDFLLHLSPDAAAAPAPAVPEWQPIETAPKETDVLIGAWIDGEFRWGRSSLFYDGGNEFEGEPASGWVWAIDDCYDSVAEAPTHWMPLPAAPADPLAQPQT